MKAAKNNVSPVRLLFVIIIVVQSSFYCHAQELPFISAINKQNLKEVRLGKSDYYLLLPVISPDSFKISVAHGIEGQLGYSVFFKDSFSIKNFFIELSHGSLVRKSYDNIEGEPFANSLLANKKVLWAINRTKTGYFSAFTIESKDLSVRFYTKTKTDIDYLISVIASLRKK